MISKIRVGIAVMSVAALAFGQTTAPTTRPSTAGKIVASAADVVPLTRRDGAQIDPEGH